VNVNITYQIDNPDKLSGSCMAQILIYGLESFIEAAARQLERQRLHTKGFRKSSLCFKFSEVGDCF
jgi:hypothetical protein